MSKRSDSCTHRFIWRKRVVGGGDGVVGGVCSEAEESIGDDGRADTRSVNGNALVPHAHCCFARLAIQELSLTKKTRTCTGRATLGEGDMGEKKYSNPIRDRGNIK